MIDHQFDAGFADEIARIESYNKHLYRPNTYLHKWWARRCGSTFRSILKHLVAVPSARDYYLPGGLEGKIILDPMMGGGTTIHEAIRLGASVIGADIDPIPYLQARASLSKTKLTVLKKQFGDLFARLREDLTPFYETVCPHCDSASELRYLLYGQRRHCLCQEVLVVDSFVLRRNNDGSVVHLSPESNDIYLDDKVVARSLVDCRHTILDRKTKSCARCGAAYQETTAVPYYQRYVPVAVVGNCQTHELFFAPPGPVDLQTISSADENRNDLGFDPDEFTIAGGPKSRALLQRGIRSYLELFSSRQLRFIRSSIDGLAALKPLIRLNLALLVSTSLEFNSMLCGYKGAEIRRAGTVRHVFARHAYAIPYTALENNPLHRARSSGTLQNLFHSRIVRGRTWALNPIERRLLDGEAKKVVIEGEVDSGIEVDSFADLTGGERRFLLIQGSSASLDLPSDCIDYVVTDPPYFDSIQYGDLATYFHVWLKQLLPGEVNWDYALVDSAVNQQTNEDGQYVSVLSDVFSECHRVLKNDGRLILTFHHWNPTGWASLTIALKRAAFTLVNRYAVHAENRASVHIVNQNALTHDVILVLAPSESITASNWEQQISIEKGNSSLFCRQCGTVVGWMLNSSLDDLEIEALWKRLLA